MKEQPTASQTVGPFFSIGLSGLCQGVGPEPAAEGSWITIRGRVLDGDGQAVPDAVLEVWQANGGFQRVSTNDDGEYAFDVLKAAESRGEAGTFQAPHAVVVLFMRGLLRQLVTRIYFAGEAANAEDAVLMMVPEDRRATLIAEPDGEGKGGLRWDVRMQGERETVFFEL